MEGVKVRDFLRKEINIKSSGIIIYLIAYIVLFLIFIFVSYVGRELGDGKLSISSILGSSLPAFVLSFPLFIKNLIVSIRENENKLISFYTIFFLVHFVLMFIL